MAGLQAIDWKNRSAYIGYFLSEDLQGRGIITKSVSAILDYIFADLRLNRAEILCAASNHRSLAIPERMGFSKEGIKKEAQWLYDHYEDLVMYRMLSSEWK